MEDKLTRFLQEHLTAADYEAAKNLPEEALREIEEQGFEAGCKYIAQLGRELFGGRSDE